VEEPPEPSLEEGPDQDGIVTLAHIALVLVDGLIQRRYGFLDRRVFRHIRWLIFFINYFTEIANELLLYKIGCLTALKDTVSEHVSLDLDAKLLPKLDDARNVNFSLLLEAQLDKVVIVVKADINPVRLILREIEG